MKRRALRMLAAAGLLALGWTAGRAQTSAPDFELIVNSPEGEVSVECVRGCELAWTERGVNVRARRMTTFIVRVHRARPASLHIRPHWRLAETVAVTRAPLREPHWQASVERPVEGTLLDSSVCSVPAIRPQGSPSNSRHVVVEFSTERAAAAFERYLKSGSGRAFAIQGPRSR